jgi:hypothetical protein
MLFIDYTISAIGNALWLFPTHTDQWQLLREKPDRIKAAFNEVLRVESPIHCFTRVAKVAATVGESDIPGSRVLVGFASANRGEWRWAGPTASTSRVRARASSPSGMASMRRGSGWVMLAWKVLRCSPRSSSGSVCPTSRTTGSQAQ